ncbi:MAG: DUF4407 domain-containing protein [Bacteroidetes bacterium]|nr:MAG: DUF4407 domain-containing protein [Bacteroidota bacterium]
MNEYAAYIDDRSEERENLSPVKRFFFACAGAYTKILEVCPSEHSKYIGIGATIFLTACLAVISGTFAIKTLIDNTFVAVMFGLLWGALIFNLDRYIVSSIRKEGKFWNEFGLALPRLILAVLISIVITKPIEIELFNNQINAELFAYTADLEKDALAKLDNKLGLDSINNEIVIADSLRKEYKKIKDGKPTSFSFGEVSKEYAIAKDQYEKVKASNERRIRSNSRLADQIWNKHAQKVYEDVRGERVFKKMYIEPQYAQQRSKLFRTNRRLQAEIDEKKKIMDDLEEARKKEEEEFKKGIDEDLFLVKEKLTVLKALKREKDSIRSIEEPAVIEKAKKYGVGFPAKIEALERMKSESSSIWWTSNLIMFLFIMLETSPVFVKMIVKRGPYDYLLSRIEHKKKISALQSISDMNYDLNKAVKRHASKMQEEQKTAAPENPVHQNGLHPGSNGKPLTPEVFTGEEAYDN